MGFDKIEAVSLTDQFVQKIESMIISGELMPGDQLPPARELSARMGAAGVEHLYREWAGDHEWPFWDVAIQRAIQYLLGYDTETSPIY